MPVTPRVSAQTLKTHIESKFAVACAAGVGITSEPIFRAPTNIRISKISLIGMAASVGIDGANPSVWVIQTRLAAVVATLATVTFNNVLVFPAAFTPYTFVISPLGISVPRDTLLCFTVANTGTAATPRTLVQVEYWINEDV